MTIAMRLSLRRGTAAMGFAAILAIGPAASAQSTWNGGGADNNWGTAGNWNQAPSFPADLVFDGGTRLAPNNNLTNPVVRNLGFGAGAGAFVIGGNAFTLGDDATADYRDGGIDHADDSLQTINTNITVSRGHHDIVTTTGGLTLGGALTRNAGAGVQFMPATGANIKTTLANTSGLLGGWATIKNPNPTIPQETYLYAKVDGSGNVVPYLDYTDDTNVNGFAAIPETTLPAGVNSATNIRWFGGPSVAENLVLGAGVTDLNTFLYEGPHDYLARVDVGVGNTLRFSDGGGFFRSNPDGVTNTIGLGFTNGTITAGHSNAPATLNIWKNTTVTPGASPDGEDDNNTVNLNGTVIANNPDGGAVAVVSSGAGGVRTENAAHTFTGGLYINRGVWRAQGAAAATPFGMGNVYVASGAQAYINNGPITIENDFYLNGRGIDEAAFFVGAMRVAADSAILNGDIILTGDTRFGNRGAQALASELGTANQGVLLNGKITGNHDLELSVKNDQGGSTIDANMPTMILANSSNNWGGDTTIGNGRIRVGGTGEVLPHGAGKGNVTLLGEGAAAARPTILTLDGQVETVNGLFSSGVETEVFVTNQTAIEATLRVGANDATSTFGGTIMDDPSFLAKLHVTKIGNGTFTMTGPNAYTGDTRVYGGTLSINTPNLASVGDVHITTGAVLNLNFAGTNSIDSLFFNGIAQATGTYGRVGSGATFQSNRFTGDGLLQVSMLGTSLIPGDFDLDNDVDAADLDRWRAGYGDGGAADADFDGDSDGNDFLIWQRNIGRTTPVAPTAGSVPEPSAAVLAGLAALGLRMTRRKRG